MLKLDTTVYRWKQAAMILLTILVALYVGILVVRAAAEVEVPVPVTVVTYGYAEHGHAVRLGGAVSYIFKHQHAHDGVHGHTREELGQ